MSSEESASTALLDATNACLKYLAKEMGYEVGKEAFIGDFLPNDKTGVFAFIISGGPEQVWGYQVIRPSGNWLANGVLIAQFGTLAEAYSFVGKLCNIMPANKKPGSTRGVGPNVELFEATLHPEIGSRPVEPLPDLVKMLWTVRQEFRVAYHNQKN